MKLCEINPFMRYAELQPSVMSSSPFFYSYDYRMFYIVEGQAQFVISGNVIPIEAGTLIYFRPETPYYFDGKVKVIVLNFDMTRNQSDKKSPITPSNSAESFDKSRVFENDPPRELEDFVVIKKAFEIENKMQECLRHFCYPTRFSDAYTSAIVKDILCYVAQNANEKEQQMPETVQRITLYIQKNYDQEISNSDIANELGYHSFYLNRVFKKSTGMTIHQAVIAERMRIAKLLLRNTNLSVSSVATESGFYDRSVFCTAFRKHTGYTPLGYREKFGME